MGLFDHFKSKDIESMDELKQMDLKPKRNDKVLTADEAFKKSIQAQDTHNKEVLSSVFERINHAVDTGIRSITLSDDWGSGFTLSDFRSLEKFEGNVLYGRYKWYAFKNEEGFWNSFAHISNEQAMGNYAVQGKDILNAPDWVKAIKPIEVKE